MAYNSQLSCYVRPQDPMQWIAHTLRYAICKGSIQADVSIKHAVARQLGCLTPPPQSLKYTFPVGSFIQMNQGQWVDISGIVVNATDIFRGGINYGGGAPKYLARGMESIGHQFPFYNFPYCLKAMIREGYTTVLKVYDRNWNDVELQSIKSEIQKGIDEGFSRFNLVLDHSGHASLASITISEGSAAICFYDSLAPSDNNYKEHYCELLINYIESFLPDNIALDKEKTSFMHIMNQGGKHSVGCGYYAIYTALVLTKNCNILPIESGNVLFNEDDDLKIRADLILRTMLSFGLENVKTDPFTRNNDGIFSRVQYEVGELVDSLKSRLQSS